MFPAVRSGASIGPYPVSDEKSIEAEISGHAGCRFDALIGGGAAKNEVLETVPAQIRLQAGADKAAVDMLDINRLARCRCGELLHHGARASRR